jgi:hypothetical protein
VFESSNTYQNTHVIMKICTHGDSIVIDVSCLYLHMMEEADAKTTLNLQQETDRLDTGTTCDKCPG